MNKKEIILVGGGGHCVSCIDVIESSNDFIIAGIIDAKDKIGTTILGYPVIGSDEDLKKLRNKYEYAIVTVGQIKKSAIRKKIFDNLINLNFTIPTIVANTAKVSSHSLVGQGTIVMHRAFINANSKIGENCIINTFALIEHDCKIGSHNHISTRSTLNGNTIIGNNCFIGSGTCINNNISITSNTIIGSNSTVINNIEKQGTYAGSPVKKISNE